VNTVAGQVVTVEECLTDITRFRYSLFRHAIFFLYGQGGSHVNLEQNFCFWT